MSTRATRIFLVPSILAVIGAALASGACSSQNSEDDAASRESSIPFAKTSPWPKFRGNAEQTALSPSFGPSSPKIDRSAKLWKVETAKGIFSSPVIDGEGTTFIGSADRTFYAIAKDGTIRWSKLTGEIIDSAALLDDRGRVYFGSGDGKLRALDAATGNEVWTMQADDPKVNTSFINWFEGNVTLGPSGTLYVPNDNFFFYAIDRDTGEVQWRFRMPDQTWSSPAIDPRDEMIYIGNNNILPTLGRNTFAITKEGETSWAEATLGSIAASPMIDKARSQILVGAFDGYTRAYDRQTGTLRWEFPTRDHVYASASLMPDGSIIQPSADGTVYDLDAETGAVRWTFDTGEPIRSSASIDAEGHVYFGGGDGKLWVINPDGTLRWSMQLIDGERNDLNSSPALGAQGIVIAGENGGIFGVPWDYCLRDDDGKADARCSTTLPTRGASEVTLRYVSAMGAFLDQVPAALDANESITLRLDARETNRTILGTLDAKSVTVTGAEVDVRVAGDGKFVVLSPKTLWPADVKLDIKASWLRDHQREGLRLIGGTRGGDVQVPVSFKTRPANDVKLSAAIENGEAGNVWELARLAVPLPTLMPSYNQIGFDSLHYLVSLVELNETTHDGIAWMIGAKLAAENDLTVIDPTTRALFPLFVHQDKDLVTFSSSETLRMEVMNAIIPFDAFRISARLGASGQAEGVAKLSGASVCATVPFYGQFLQKLGLCNPQTDELVVVGGAELRAPKKALEGPKAKSSEPAKVSLLRQADAVVAKIDEPIRAADHVVGILLVDPTTNRPVALDYGLTTKRELDAAGNITSVSIPFGTKKMPGGIRAHVIVDTKLLATKTL